LLAFWQAIFVNDRRHGVPNGYCTIVIRPKIGEIAQIGGFEWQKVSP
jgi:hypothetical protein